MKRRIASLFIVFLLIFTTVLALPKTEARAESLYVKKIVSVVYDDSGSMKNSDASWAYANYALQAFCGLLNSDDRLFVTYMSGVCDNTRSYSPEEIALDAKSVQRSVDKVRAHKEASGTPYEAIDFAYNKLCSVQDSNPNTQYWLVVLTDGQFSRFTSSGGSVTDEDLNQKMTDIANSTMPNGSAPQITYLGIGRGASVPSVGEPGVYVYNTPGAKDIVGVMAQIADKISGRSRVEPQNIRKIDSNTIEFTSGVPLMNIAVLIQETKAKIKSVKCESGQNLQTIKSASIKYPEKRGWTTDKSLIGSAWLIGNGSKNIEAGTYQVTFDGKIEIDNLVIMIEPAIELRFILNINGVEVTDLSKLHDTRVDDEIDISCRIFEFGTDNEIPANLLPEGTTYKVEGFENGVKVTDDITGQMAIRKYKLKEGVPTEFVGSVSIKGFNTITVSTGEFSPLPPNMYRLELIREGNLSFKVQDLKNNTDKIRFIIYENDIPVTKEAVQNMDFKIDTVMPGVTQIEDDGSITFTPTYQEPVTSIPTGDITVTGIFNGTLAKKTEIHVNDLDYEVRADHNSFFSIYRTDLSNNQQGVRFEIFAEGVKLGKAEVEKLKLDYAINAMYNGKLDIEPEIADDGAVIVVPKYGKHKLFAKFYVPVGKMEIRVSVENAADSAVVDITKNDMWELFWTVIVPSLIVITFFGELFKPRFKYSYKIHCNVGTASGAMVSGHRGNWQTHGLFTMTAFIPFIPDSKTIDGVRFIAKGIFANSAFVKVKVKKLPVPSGILTDQLSDLKAARFNKNNVDEFSEGEKVRDLIPGNSLIVSGDVNYKHCFIYLYSEI